MKTSPFWHTLEGVLNFVWEAAGCLRHFVVAMLWLIYTGLWTIVLIVQLALRLARGVWRTLIDPDGWWELIALLVWLLYSPILALSWTKAVFMKGGPRRVRSYHDSEPTHEKEGYVGE